MSEYLSEQQQAEEEADRSRVFDSIREDAQLKMSLWDNETVTAWTYFPKSREIFTIAAKNYYDEAELGRIVKKVFGEAIDAAIEARE